jgi:EmrB/QacA subfamily drug resistance transporter
MSSLISFTKATANSVKPRKTPRGWTLATLCLAVLIAQLDTSIVNLAMRPIGQYFQASVGALQWIMDGYNLVYAVFLLTGGLLAALFGRRCIFMAGAAVFALASIGCALSPSVGILIAGRAFAGLGAALVLPASLALIRVVWPEAKARAKAVGIWAGCNGLALAIGPTLGGLLTAHFGWRSIFFVVVPLGIAALATAPLCVPESADPKDRRFDAGGQTLGALALGGLALAAIESHRWPILAAAACAGAALALGLFLWVEARLRAAALVPLDLFRAPAFNAAMIATAGMTFGMYSLLFLLPLTWQSTGALGPVGAGLALMPMALVFVSVSSYSGALTQRLGTRVMTGGGVAVIGCGLLLIALTVPAAGLAGAEAGVALTGLGMGLATGPLMGAAVGAVSAARSGSAATLINVARMVGATLGVAALGAVFAVAGGGFPGLRAALLLGGGVQLAAAVVAWCR